MVPRFCYDPYGSPEVKRPKLWPYLWVLLALLFCIRYISESHPADAVDKKKCDVRIFAAMNETWCADVAVI